ncbi:YnfA family protein [Desulforamulus ruminis]|uniref:Uncharacterized protein n=1 Tax=Desulforamulus ruminis (strain ATCC 23193 / DSM 2154 / NCIMB 8452 / DL) TaxID=696281 RepID=F6DM44_DESRL|nr:YnfA family protein [Desulforamulus ruminis]AEG59386.1 protein of unknown function UPF0060 [Desulforamulus ruminis DSM 2154]
MFIRSTVLFLLAGLSEIAGGYFIWIWLRYDATLLWGVLGAVVLVLYGIIPCFQRFPNFGRIYAAYGGVFVVLSIFWGWWIDGSQPDFFDWLGTLIVLGGTTLMLWAPRKQPGKEAVK